MRRKTRSKSKKVLAYGSLYVDQAESYEFAETQIDECIATAQLPVDRILLAFDLIATPAQMASGVARRWGQRLLNSCDGRDPQLAARVVGITDDDTRQVMRDTLITRTLTGNEIDDVHLIEME